MLRFALAFLVAATGSADAQIGLPAGVAQLSPIVGAAPAYVGPGDLVSGAKAWYGLRAYNAAYATGSNPAITIRRASDGATATVNILASGNLDTATAGAFCASTTCFVTEAFDQSGSGLHATQPTASAQPQLVVSCVGGRPCMMFSGGQLLTVNAPTIAQPVTQSAVGIRTGAFTSLGNYYEENNGNGAFLQMRYDTTANTIAVVSTGGTVKATASDSAWHSLAGIANGSSSAMAVDGAATTGTITGGGFVGGSAAVGSTPVNGQGLTGDIAEYGIWGVAFSSAQRTSVCHSQYVYWGTSVSC